MLQRANLCSIFHNIFKYVIFRRRQKALLRGKGLTGGCTGSSEPIHDKMPHCWKSHVTAHMVN